MAVDLVAILWLGISALFSWYASSFGKFNETYDSLGAVIGFMTWLRIFAIVILLGAELDAEMEHQTARDTTTGSPKPMGHEGPGWLTRLERPRVGGFQIGFVPVTKPRAGLRSAERRSKARP